MNTIKKTLGKRISQFRKQKKLTQYELAEIIGMDDKNLSRIETGHIYPNVENLEQIIKALDVKAWQLFHEEDELSIEAMKSEILSGLENDKTVISLYLHLKTVKF